MAHEKHLRLQIAGDYVPNTLPGEIWETTLRLGLNFGSIDDIGSLTSAWDPSAATIARTESDWTITGNWTVHVGFDNFAPDDYLNDQVAPAVIDWMAALNLSNQVRVRTLKLMPCDSPNGAGVPAPPYATGSPCTLEWTSSYPTGGASGTQLPPQNSVVVSHRGAQVGARGRGRMFLPTITSSALSGAKLAATPQGEIRDAHIAFLEALALSPLSPTAAHVRPIITGKPFTEYSVINQVRVGNVVDTQRRRRNALTETYVSDSVSY